MSSQAGQCLTYFGADLEHQQLCLSDVSTNSYANHVVSIGSLLQVLLTVNEARFANPLSP